MSSDSDDIGELIAYLLIGGLALAGAKQAWSSTVRPWIERTWAQLADPTTQGPVLADLDRVDLIGIAILALPAAAFLTTIIRRARRNNQQQKKDEKKA